MLRSRLPLALPGWRVALLALGVAAGAIVAASAVGSLFIWNLSPSLPRGLYRLDRSGTPSRGTIVAFEPPSRAASLILERGYLPRGALLLKRVVALHDDHVCIEDAFSVNGGLVGAVLRRDSSGRPLEAYRFCGSAPPGYAFVATLSAASFDSRYFGPLPIQSLTLARPVWTF